MAQGWLRRARSLLDDGDPCPELGWLYVHEAEKVLVAGDSQRARELGAQATELGRRFGIVDLEMMGSATEGLALVSLGEVEEGITRLGEAAAAALAGEFAELWAAGWCCCYMIYGCEQVRDYDRAAQWCRQLETWSERLHVQFLSRTCRAHYAGVLIWQGTWEKAETELIESATHLAELRPPMAVEALVRLGELRRRQGRLQEAAVIFEKAADHPLAVLGSGELQLDDEDPAGARERAEEYLRQTSSGAVTPRAAGLELLARASAALGDAPGAAAALAELSTVAERIPTDAVRASVAYARGTVASATETATALASRSRTPSATTTAPGRRSRRPGHGWRSPVSSAIWDAPPMRCGTLVPRPRASTASAPLGQPRTPKPWSAHSSLRNVGHC